MSRSPLQVQILLDHLHCHDEGDGWGSAEPYMWTVYFKVDGDTVALGDDLFLHGTATVTSTPGSHGNLGDTDVDAGDDVPVPAAIGRFSTALTPIPVPGWVRELGVDDVGGVAGVAVVLMEEDGVSDAGAEAGHAALNQFIQQAIDALIPTLGASNPDVDEEDIAQLTAGAEAAIAQAVQDAQGAWDNFVSWLNADDHIGNKVWTFSHDNLVEQPDRDISQRWDNDGDWELFGRVLAVPGCPAEASMGMLMSHGAISEQDAQSALDAARQFRQGSFAGSRALGAWWRLAQRNAAAIADVLRQDSTLARQAAAVIATGLPGATMSQSKPLSDALLQQLGTLLEAFEDRGPRRLRIDAKAALAVLPQLQGKTLEQAVKIFSEQAPTRKINRLPRSRKA
jgi:hypothetical protein